MNQPASRCNGWVDNLVRIFAIDEVEATNPLQGVLDGYALEDQNPPSPGRFGGAEGAVDVDMDPEPVQGSTVEEFPGAAKVFPGEWVTFLGRFDRDAFSNQRQSNPYYPFTSRSDWEFGMWLTRSGLSLAAVDSLLSLELVSVSNITNTPTPN